MPKRPKKEGNVFDRSYSSDRVRITRLICFTFAILILAFVIHPVICEIVKSTDHSVLITTMTDSGIGILSFISGGLCWEKLQKVIRDFF